MAHSLLYDLERVPVHSEVRDPTFWGRERLETSGGHTAYLLQIAGCRRAGSTLSAEPLLQPRHQLRGQLGVLLGLLGVPNFECKPVGLLDKLRAQNSLREDLSHCQPGPVSEEVS